MKTLSLYLFKLESLLKKYNLIIFVVLVCAGLVVVVLSVANIIQDSVQTPTAQTSPTSVDTELDQNTINKINSLSSSIEAPDLSLPSGRYNPFSE